jgi:pectate lyase
MAEAGSSLARTRRAAAAAALLVLVVVAGSAALPGGRVTVLDGLR